MQSRLVTDARLNLWPSMTLPRALHRNVPMQCGATDRASQAMGIKVESVAPGKAIISMTVLA